MVRVPGHCVCTILLAVAGLPLGAQSASPAPSAIPAQSAADLVRDVVYNEARDSGRTSHWEYRSERVSEDQNVVREQVETTRGPVFRVIEQNGSPLDSDQQRQEEQRLDQYLSNPSAVAAAARSHEQDEDHLMTAMQLLPAALLFDYQGAPEGDVVRLAFHPNPAFSPSGYEARIVHALTGTVTVDARLKRMIAMQGTVAQRVDFGYGFLGHVEQGGTFVIHRRQVSGAHWKTDLVDLHLQGKILLLKTISKDQREARSDFRPVPEGTTLAEAKDMLREAAGQGTQARLTPTALESK
jgi:hypothetical protein